MYCSYHDGHNEDANCACTCNSIESYSALVPKTVSQVKTLINTDPGAMLTFIAEGKIESPALLSYAAEDLQLIPDQHKQHTDKKYTACDAAIGLLYHQSPIVREGALLCVAQCGCYHTWIHLVSIFYDPSQTLREMARQDCFPHVAKR